MPEPTPYAAAAEAPARANTTPPADLFGALTRPRTLADLKSLSKATGKRLTELVALSTVNDPYCFGTKAHCRDARWFADWWTRFDLEFVASVHLRAIHYRLVSQDPPPVKPDSTPYVNTLECWQYLGGASKAARYLGLVDAKAFTDNRNPAPIIRAYSQDDTEPQLELDDWGEWELPRLELAVGKFALPLPTFSASGYEYDTARQPYHLELWIEKSTMNDVLLPICKEYGVNLVTSAGFQSISSVIRLLQRAASHKKPVRVFYVSDFDPAGSFMPDAVARQIEFWRDRYGISEEIKLQPLALTREQVIQWQLPAIPIKESDRRKQGFISRYGQEATELDALEALHPGALADLVTAAIEQYRDPNLRNAYLDTKQQTGDVADNAATWVIGDQEEEWQAIQTGVNGVLARYSPQFAALNDDLQQDLEPYRPRIKNLRHAIQNSVDLVGDNFDLPDLPEPDIDEPDEDDWLFDSGRDYLEQIAVYQQRRGADDDDNGEEQ